MDIDSKLMKVALKVFDFVEQNLKEFKPKDNIFLSAYVNCYANCREQGLHLKVSFLGGEGVEFSWAEHRVSDGIIVYWGETDSNMMSENRPFAWNTNIPSDDTYNNRSRMFECGEHKEAADFITNKMKEIYQKWYESHGKDLLLAVK